MGSLGVKMKSPSRTPEKYERIGRLNDNKTRGIHIQTDVLAERQEGRRAKEN